MSMSSTTAESSLENEAFSLVVGETGGVAQQMGEWPKKEELEALDVFLDITTPILLVASSSGPQVFSKMPGIEDNDLITGYTQKGKLSIILQLFLLLVFGGCFETIIVQLHVLW